jgi:hypothetical protein
MGPWFNNAAHTALFVNIPVNQKMNYRIPRTPTVPVTKSRAQGEIGMFADGVRIFDAGEIANASNALLQLDENGDGQLTGEELRPPGPFPGGPPPGEFGNPPPPPPW